MSEKQGIIQDYSGLGVVVMSKIYNIAELLSLKVRKSDRCNYFKLWFSKVRV